MNEQSSPLSLDSSLTNHTHACGIIFSIHKPTKSVLLFQDQAFGLSGYVFRDPDNDLALKEKALRDFKDKTGIKVLDQNPSCPHVFEKQTIEGPGWYFIILLNDIKIPSKHKGVDLPLNSKWYHVNQILYSKIRCDQLRNFLKGVMENM